MNFRSYLVKQGSNASAGGGRRKAARCSAGSPAALERWYERRGKESAVRVKEQQGSSEDS